MNAPATEPLERAHAVLSASGAHRWLVCTPSARLEETLPEETSAYADEGTLAHAVAATELARWLFRIAASDYTDAWTAYRADKRVTPDFRAAVSAYVEACKAKIAAVRKITSDAVILLEQRLDYSHIVPEGFGTGDLILIADGVLEVIDLKFGQGVPVSPEHNEQEMLYGLGALAGADFLYDIHTVRLTIHQPRVGDGLPRSWDIPVGELLYWAQNTVAPRAQLAWAGEGDFVPGEHCGFCKAKATCRARARHALQLTQHEFRDPPLLSDDEVGDILGRIDALTSWAGHVKAHALAAAKAGKRFFGWKLVRGRSVRTYGDRDKVAAALLAGDIPEAIVFERSLLGITALEKAITKKRFAELLPEPLVTKPPGALVLAPAADPRQEVESSALEGFENLTQPGEPE